MKNNQNKSSVAIRLSFFLLAIMPLTGGNDVLFYASTVLCGVLFISALVMTIMNCKEEKWNLLSLMRTNRKHDLVDVVIAIVGILVCSGVGYYNFSYFWWACCLVALCRLLINVRKGISG